MKLELFSKFKNPFENMQKQRFVMLVDKENVDLRQDEVSDIIISPRFYWVKKQKLPVKYAYQARSYAPSAFDGLIPAGEYKYLCKKCKDEFYLYAYDDVFIFEELLKLGLKAHQIGRIFFAQNEFSSIEQAIKVNENEVLALKDGMLIQIPAKLTSKSMELRDFFKNNKLSNFFISLNKFNKIVDFKKAYLVSSLLFILLLFYSIELIGLNSIQNEQELKRESIQRTYKLPSTSMQTKALLRKYDKKLSLQQNIRERFYLLTKMPLKKGEFVSELKYENKKFNISLTLLSSHRVSKIEDYIKKHFNLQNINKSKNKVSFEVKI